METLHVFQMHSHKMSDNILSHKKMALQASRIAE
jgi:hypothetical protein